MRKIKKSKGKVGTVLKKALQESLKEWNELSSAQQAKYQNLVPSKPSGEK